MCSAMFVYSCWKDHFVTGKCNKGRFRVCQMPKFGTPQADTKPDEELEEFKIGPCKRQAFYLINHPVLLKIPF